MTGGKFVDDLVPLPSRKERLPRPMLDLEEGDRICRSERILGSSSGPATRTKTIRPNDSTKSGHLRRSSSLTDQTGCSDAGRIIESGQSARCQADSRGTCSLDDQKWQDRSGVVKKK